MIDSTALPPIARPPHANHLPFGGATPARLHQASANQKLSPVGYESAKSGRRKLRQVPVAPYCSSTYVSIKATCPSTCRFRDGACYVQSGFTGFAGKLLDEGAEGLSGLDVIREEVRLIDRAFRSGTVPQDGGRDGVDGRDLRLHVGGDTPSAFAATLLAGAADRWRARRGGDVWTYTHRWRAIPRESFGSVSVLASVESAKDAAKAIARGYVPALVVADFPSKRAFDVRGIDGWRVVPCPAETGSRTCVTCRLCLDDGALRKRKVAIAFEAHGRSEAELRRRLPVVRVIDEGASV